MHINIFSTPITSYVSTPIPSELLEELSTKLKFRIHGYEYTQLGRSGQWDGYKRLFKRRDRSFPTGCIRRVLNIFKGAGHTFDVEYSVNDLPVGELKVADIKPFPFQFECAQKAIDGRYGIIHAPVRAGKTAIIGLMLSRISQHPTWIITYGKDLVVQTQREMERFLQKKVGLFSESVFEDGDVIVSSYQALSRLYDSVSKSSVIKHRNVEIKASIENAKVLILDECQYALAPKTSVLLSKFDKVSFRIGLSGTPKPTNKSRLEVEAVIGPILVKIPIKQLIELKRIAKPVALIYDLPATWFTYHLDEFAEWYEANIVRNVCRNKLISKLVDKLNAQNKTCFVMVRKRYHGELLQELIPRSVYVHGDIASNIRKELYSRLHKKEISCIISTVGKVGLDIPNLNAVINAEGLAAETITLQKMRSLTASSDKDYGIIIDFMDHGVYLRDHSELRLAMYKKIDGFIIKEFKVPPTLFGETDGQDGQ